MFCIPMPNKEVHQLQISAFSRLPRNAGTPLDDLVDFRGFVTEQKVLYDAQNVTSRFFSNL